MEPFRAERSKKEQKMYFLISSPSCFSFYFCTLDGGQRLLRAFVFALSCVSQLPTYDEDE